MFTVAATRCSTQYCICREPTRCQAQVSQVQKGSLLVSQEWRTWGAGWIREEDAKVAVKEMGKEDRALGLELGRSASQE